MKQKGFTLIELMIVVAIIGILAAIAIIPIMDYVIKTQVTRAFGEMNSVRSELEVCLANGQVNLGDVNVAPPAGQVRACTLGYTGSSILESGGLRHTAHPQINLPAGTGVPTINPEIPMIPPPAVGAPPVDGPVIRATFGNNSHNYLRGLFLEIGRQADGTWLCNQGNLVTTTTIDGKYLPASC